MIVSIAILIVGIIGGAISQQLTNELKSWTPWVVDRLRKRAVRKLPMALQERYEEEWRSFLAEIPGEIGPILYAFDLQRAAAKIRLEARLEAASQRFIRILRFIRTAPTIYRIIRNDRQKFEPLILGILGAIRNGDNKVRDALASQYAASIRGSDPNLIEFLKHGHRKK
jgi:hypothetical protein